VAYTTIRVLTEICLHKNQEGFVAIRLNVLSSLKDFSRSHTVTYAVKVAVGLARKQCQIETSLLQTWNDIMTYQTAPFQTDL